MLSLYIKSHAVKMRGMSTTFLYCTESLLNFLLTEDMLCVYETYIESYVCCVLIADVRQQVSDVLNLFTGTHNFHNFTSGKYAVILISMFYRMKIISAYDLIVLQCAFVSR